MLKLTIKSLQAELVSLRKISDDNYENGRKWRGLAEEREKQVAAVKEKFADLKERIANAESETARLRGYLDRVHEDDIVRDGMVEIEDAHGKRQVPKRPPPMQAMSKPVTHHDLYDGLSGDRKKRAHWTNY